MMVYLCVISTLYLLPRLLSEWYPSLPLALVRAVRILPCPNESVHDQRGVSVDSDGCMWCPTDVPSRELPIRAERHHSHP